MSKSVFNCFMIIIMIYFSNSLSIKKTQTILRTRDENCANENGICNLPDNQVCSIAYGQDSRWTQKHGQIGQIGCNNGIFGDPFVGTLKRCYYFNCVQYTQCANENGVCQLPQNSKCSVSYGVRTGWNVKQNIIGPIGCNNGIFGDAFPGIYKTCNYYNCVDVGPICANENGVCVVPQNQVCSIRYGIDSRWTVQTNFRGSIGCNNGVFGDPAVGTLKICFLVDCVNFDFCAVENEICSVPDGQQCTVQYGVNGRFAVRPFAQGNIGCNNGVFGDPFVGTRKSCKLFDCQPSHIPCSKENGICQLPEGQKCSIRYGVDTRWTNKPLLTGNIGCNNGVFGDPAVGTYKDCYYYACQAIDITNPQCTITGVLFDATLNLQIPANIVNAGNPVVQYIELSGDGLTLTAPITDGMWSIRLRKGRYRRTVSMNGWSTRTREITVDGNGASYPLNRVLLSPSVDGWRIVLTWGALPKDLDSHLVLSNGSEVNYQTKRFQQGLGEITLDVDNTNGFGPETVTLKKVSGVYRYFVQSYSNEVPLSNSNAKVVLYRGDQQINEIEIPEGSGSKRNWYVYEIDATNNTWKIFNNFDGFN